MHFGYGFQSSMAQDSQPFQRIRMWSAAKFRHKHCGNYCLTAERTLHTSLSCPYTLAHYLDVLDCSWHFFAIGFNLSFVSDLKRHDVACCTGPFALPTSDLCMFLPWETGNGLSDHAVTASLDCRCRLSPLRIVCLNT